MLSERDEFWNLRYGNAEYVYGEEPNEFFVNQISKLKKGNLLLPCEGEGRNAVYAAALGWQVNAFDRSSEGKNKALQLAQKKGVIIDYQIADASVIDYPENSFDIVAFIYAHFSSTQRAQIHKKAISWLRPGGKIILEAFNPKQLKNNSGGPKELSMLYTLEMLQSDFSSLRFDLIQNIQTTLKEGSFHDGIADVIQFVGAKLF
ncbi:MAG: class I SAM-dependent methyltransferase [Bacteroidota bacterium]